MIWDAWGEPRVVLVLGDETWEIVACVNDDGALEPVTFELTTEGVRMLIPPSDSLLDAQIQ